MKNLLFSLLALSSTAAVALPKTLICWTEITAERALQYRFVFTQLPREIYPPHYQVTIVGKRLDGLRGNPYDTASSDEPARDDGVIRTVLVDATRTGARDAQDQDLVRFFNGGGFVKYTRASDTVTYQLAGQRIPTYVSNCEEPEIGVTVHN